MEFNAKIHSLFFHNKIFLEDSLTGWLNMKNSRQLS